MVGCHIFQERLRIVCTEMLHPLRSDALLFTKQEYPDTSIQTKKRSRRSRVNLRTKTSEDKEKKHCQHTVAKTFIAEVTGPGKSFATFVPWHFPNTDKEKF